MSDRAGKRETCLRTAVTPRASKALRIGPVLRRFPSFCVPARAGAITQIHEFGSPHWDLDGVDEVPGVTDRRVLIRFCMAQRLQPPPPPSSHSRPPPPPSSKRSEPPPPPSRRSLPPPPRRTTASKPPPGPLSLPPAALLGGTATVRAEEDSFFRAGDEGTYAGGPAASIAPIALDAELPSASNDPSSAAPELLLRRQRWQRVVTTVVATLGAACLVLFSFQFGKRQGEKQARNDESSHRAPAATPTEAQPSRVEAPRAEAPTPDPAAEALQEDAPPIAVQTAPTPKRSRRNRLPFSRAASVVDAPYVPAEHTSFVTETHSDPTAPSSLATFTVSRTAQSHGAAPPTAYFPD